MDKIVDGATQLLGIVVDPIRQVRSPELLSALFRAQLAAMREFFRFPVGDYGPGAAARVTAA
jgi:hypothetical protein